MRQAFFLFLILVSTDLRAQSSNAPSLDLIKVLQMTPYDSLPFDLSGIVEVNNKIYVIADKNWNKYIYEAELSNSSFIVKNEIPLNVDGKLDLEAIDYCDSQFYIANERSGDIYRVSINNSKKTVSTLPLDFESRGYKLTQWKNAGWEGLAMDCDQQKLYLTKERQPRIIFIVDTKTNQIISEFNIPEVDSNDFSDAKFNNGFLYLLERNGNYITKIDPETQSVVSKVTYKHITSHPEGKLYTNSKYGLAEALLLKDNEIWLALDNNGNTASQHAITTYNMKGTTPVILKFKRPLGF